MNIQQAYYGLHFELAFRQAKGESFQKFFEQLMGLAYKADFMACRPWGNQGDRKNDGFLKSEKRLFQVYAPNEMAASKAIKKIQTDFDGAKAYWGKHFNKWVFVHNAVEGLPPHVQKILLDFEKQNPGIAIEPWGLEEFKVIFRKLTSEDMETWFGVVPTDETKNHIGFKDLQVVLEAIANQPVISSQPVKDVPTRKIEANALSENIVVLLKTGMTKASLVESFFNQWHDISFGERIATSFRNKYGELRMKFTPNQVFNELLIWVGGGQRGAAEHELAVLSIVAYFFERCDIFEEPRSTQI